MRYAVVIENAGSNFSAYVPDLPGCIATGATLPDVEAAIRQAIERYARHQAEIFESRAGRHEWPVRRAHVHRVFGLHEYPCIEK